MDSKIAPRSTLAKKTVRICSHPYDPVLMNNANHWNFVVNDNAPANSVRVHIALCRHARE